MTAQARRAQIVAATIDVIAEIGYGQTSFARIAEHAKLSSTRLISYHFAGKDELITAVAEDAITSIGDHLARQLAAETTASGMLRAYIEGMVQFTATHRSRMKALLEIFLNGGLHYDATTDQSVVGHVETILRQGQAGGEFREFDARVMATAVQRAVEGLPFLLESTPDLDCAAYGRELVTLFELGTRRSSE
ncbi:AcrR family transcriptional regulator [Nakamurella sp. UYEF19]|uniref:TetR/AcrR family transcriptional regulator n=1 Tax=Nakamurella sp. UYEF19 TaxID=1756392 RepID=UPI0033980811